MTTDDHGNGELNNFMNVQNVFSHSEGLRDLGGERRRACRSVQVKYF